jgi:hypothetical protein
MSLVFSGGACDPYKCGYLVSIGREATSAVLRKYRLWIVVDAFTHDLVFLEFND